MAPHFGENSEPPAEKCAKSAHQTPTPGHATLPVFPCEPSSDRALFCEVFAGKFAIDLFVLAVSLSGVFSLENHSNSWMWSVLFVYVQQLNDPSLLQAWLNMSAVQFSNCAHGGERPKQTTWRSTHDVFDHLAKPCPGDHVHKPYQVTKSFGAWTFDTAAESEYPWLLCTRLCQALHQKFAKSFNLSPPKKQVPAKTDTKKLLSQNTVASLDNNHNHLMNIKFFLHSLRGG